MSENLVNCFGDVFERWADLAPGHTVVVQGEQRVTMGAFDRRANGLATAMLDAGLERQSRVALYLYNCPEYLETYVAATKVSLVPVNTNYRYGAKELLHLWSDADVAAVVFHGTFTETVERIREQLPHVKLWLWVDDGSDTCPTFAQSYTEAVGRDASPSPWPRSGEDLFFIYTGGTTGLPKGVMWRQDAMLRLIFGAGFEGLEQTIASRAEEADREAVMPAPPLMHGTGLLMAFRGLFMGDTVVLPAGRQFDAAAIWDAVERERVTTISVVGDAFVQPLLAALDDEPDRWDLSSLQVLTSSGAILSEPVRFRLLDRLPKLTCIDRLASSENAIVATRTSRSGDLAPTGSFKPVAGVRIVDDEGRDVEPGSGRVGVLAVPGGAVGYHNDPEKTSRTFPVLDGTRYTITGDYATIESDGSLRFVGRGSVCINTGGEKVFPEEVEEALKSHDEVTDAVVVGVPDPKFGETVAAVIEVSGAGASDGDLIAHVRDQLAGYKAPRRIVRVDVSLRGPNGKPDYGAARDRVLSEISAETCN